MTEIDFSTDPRYDYWRRALAGEYPEAPINEAQCGFYFMRMVHGGTTVRVPVAISPDDSLTPQEAAYRGGLVAFTGFDPFASDDPNALWPRVAGFPIADSLYWEAIEAGYWPDTAGLVPPPQRADYVEPLPSSNLSSNPDPAEVIADQIKSAIAVLDSVLAKGVETKAAADLASNSVDRLRALWKEAETARKGEKDPLDAQIKIIQARWTPLQAEAKGAADKALAAITKWQQAERTRLENEQRELDRIAAEKAKAVEAEHRAAVEAAKAADLPPPEAPPVEAAPQLDTRPKTGGALSGRRTSLRTFKRAIIDDYEVLFDKIKQTDEIREVAQMLADKSARGGFALPGTHIVEEERAV